MASVSSSLSLPVLPSPPVQTHLERKSNIIVIPTAKRRNAFRVRAAKLPAGVEMPKMEPKLTEPFLGFTKTAEIWNSRACMMGLIGTFIVELILHRGILQMIGVEVGKGLDLPL